METNSPTMTPEQGLRIIETMLARTQQKLQDNGLLYRLWGYLVFFSALIQYIGIWIYKTDQFGMVWMILMPAGGLLTWYITSKKDYKPVGRTFMDDILKDVLLTFFVSMAFSLIFGSALASWSVAYGFVMLAYGSWLFISGGMLKFRAMKIGGIINWLSGAACFFLDGPQCLLMLAFAVLAGYIIPGHLIQKQYRRENGEK